MKKKLLLLGICSLILLTGCTGGSEEEKTGSTNTDVKVQINKTEGLTLQTYNGKNDDMVLVVKNDGKETVDYISIDVAFYDKSGKLMKTDKQYARNLLAGKEYVAKLSLVEYTEEGKTALPEKIEIALNKTNYSTDFEQIHTEKVSGKVDKTENEGELTLTVTNESGVTLNELATAVVFYKDSKPVDVIINSLQDVGPTSTTTVYIPTYVADEKTKYLDYDDVKVVINNASTYIQFTE